MKQLKIKDNTLNNKEAFTDISALVSRIQDKTLSELEKEGVFIFPESIRDMDDLSGDQMILQSYNGSIASTNVMGFIGRGDQRLVIESRFSRGERDFFLQYLLGKVIDFPNILDMETEADTSDAIFNLFVFLFPKYLKDAMRKGLYKIYVRKEYNDENIKGTISVGRHIRQNTPFLGSIAYNQREHSYENYVLELIRHTIEYIKSKPYGKGLLHPVKDYVELVIKTTTGYEYFDRRAIIDINKKKSIRHAYYREYRTLQQLCLLILQNQEHYVGSGSRKIYGVLFDGAWLWEEYINMLISDDFYHPMNKSGREAQTLFRGGFGRIYPDFISKNYDNRVIADAKYKPVDNIGNRDFLQILAYMYRFDSKKGYYLYPDAEDEADKELYLNSGSTYEKNVNARKDVVVIKHGLKVSKEINDYNIFEEEMALSEKMFVETIKKVSYTY